MRNRLKMFVLLSMLLLLAAVLFREHLGGRTWTAVLLVTCAGMVLS